MQIYIRGNEDQLAAIRTKLSDDHVIEQFDEPGTLPDQSDTVVFDFLPGTQPQVLAGYRGLKQIKLFINATRHSLAALVHEYALRPSGFYGFAGDPTFVERPLLEVSTWHGSDLPADELCAQLSVEATAVADRVGLVTPRIVAMIINEAYYTIMEGTASRTDIDTGMKLGTNYPMGPFEWATKWGLANIYQLLDALYHDTHDERYKVCPLLKQEWLQASD